VNEVEATALEAGNAALQVLWVQANRQALITAGVRNDEADQVLALIGAPILPQPGQVPDNVAPELPHAEIREEHMVGARFNTQVVAEPQDLGGDEEADGEQQVRWQQASRLLTKDGQDAYVVASRAATDALKEARNSRVLKTGYPLSNQQARGVARGGHQGVGRGGNPAKPPEEEKQPSVKTSIFDAVNTSSFANTSTSTGKSTGSKAQGGPQLMGDAEIAHAQN
jgi:hypothetical protein